MQSEWCKTYWKKNCKAINAKRREQYREMQDGRLMELLQDYDGGMSATELCDKYKVNKRKEK